MALEPEVGHHRRHQPAAGEPALHAPSRRRSAPSIGRRRPPGRSRRRRSAGRRRRPMRCRSAAPEATTVSHRVSGAVEPTPSLMFLPLGVTADRDHFGAELPERRGRDLIGRAIGAIDHDLEPVERQIAPERSTWRRGYSVRAHPRRAAPGRYWRRAPAGPRRRSAPRSRARPHRRACSRRGRTA